MNYLSELKNKWEESKKIFSLLIHENRINELDCELENIENYISNKYYNEAESSIHIFKEKLKQISENEKINIGNIL